MSEEICYRDQDRLDYIFEQVKALSDVVDELRTEVSDLKKVSLSAKRGDVLFGCTKVNCEIDHVRPCVVDNVKTYLRNVRDLTATEEIHQLAKNSQVYKFDLTSPSYTVQNKREEDEEPSSCKSSPTKNFLSTIYDGLKSFKNKLVKIIHSVPAPRIFLKSTKDNCVEFNGQRQIRLARKEEKRKFSELDRENENDVSKCIDINEEPDDSTETSLTSDVFAQADITTCSCQEDDKKSVHSLYQDVTKSNVQTSPLSLMTDNRLIVHSDWVTGESSKGCVKRGFLKNKRKKYKICSCGNQCPYALYKLPCCDQNDVLENKGDDEIDGLTLECSSFEEKNNFPKFVNIEASEEECNKCPGDLGTDESSASSLSMDLEVDVCGDYSKPEENIVDEFPKQRTMTHIINGTSARRNDNANNAMSHFKTENKLLCVNVGANQQEYRTRMEDFTHDYQPIKSNDKQVQCSSETLRAIRREFARTSALDDFRRSDTTNRLCRATNTTKRINFLKVMTPRQVKINTCTQTERRSHFNHLQGIDLSTALSFGNEQNLRHINKNKNKKMLRERNICDICDLSRKKVWPRIEGYDAQFAFWTEENSENILLNKRLNKMFTC